MSDSLEKFLKWTLEEYEKGELILNGTRSGFGGVTIEFVHKSKVIPPMCSKCAGYINEEIKKEDERK